MFIPYTCDTRNQIGGCLGQMYIGEDGYCDVRCFDLKSMKLRGYGGIILYRADPPYLRYVKRVKGGFILNDEDTPFTPEYS